MTAQLYANGLRTNRHKSHGLILQGAKLLIFLLFLIGAKGLVKKSAYLHLSTEHPLSDSYTIFFDNTELSSSTLNIFCLPLAKEIFLTSIVTRYAFGKLGVQYRGRQYFSPSRCLHYAKPLITQTWSMHPYSYLKESIQILFASSTPLLFLPLNLRRTSCCPLLFCTPIQKTRATTSSVRLSVCRSVLPSVR